MKRLNHKDNLFLSLEKENPDWWQVLIADKDIYIDIRKDNYIDVYYNGGNIISELKHNGEEYSGKINYKYLLPEKSEYIKYDFSWESPSLIKSQVDLINLKSFDEASIKRIKANISKYYPASSEKGIQARFIKNAEQFIDSEFAYNYGNEKLRIDLIWIDIKAKKIVPVELKTMGDSRLYTNEIFEQLKKYNDFMVKFENEVLAYYKILFLLKKRLKILSQKLKVIKSLDDFTIEKKPLLIFGDCQQKWIDNNSLDIDSKINSIAYGTYYYGSTKSSCNLNQHKHKNRHIY